MLDLSATHIRMNVARPDLTPTNPVEPNPTKRGRGRPPKAGGAALPVTVRLLPPSLRWLDDHAARLQAQMPGLVLSRGDALRNVIARVMSGELVERTAVPAAPQRDEKPVATVEVRETPAAPVDPQAVDAFEWKKGVTNPDITSGLLSRGGFTAGVNGYAGKPWRWWVRASGKRGREVASGEVPNRESAATAALAALEAAAPGRKTKTAPASPTS